MPNKEYEARRKQQQKQIDKLKEEAEKKSAENLETYEPITYDASRAKAVKEAEDMEPILKEMNDKYAYIDSIGGKPWVMTKTLKGKTEFISTESLENRHRNIKVLVPPKSEMPLGKWWLDHPFRRTYALVEFNPKMGPGEFVIGEGLAYNTWQGFGVEDKKGSMHLIIRHIYRILCNSDKAKFKYVMRWFAWAIQNPHDRARVALIFKGGKGAGKGCILTMFKNIFGAHGFATSNRKHLVGNFNDHLDNKCYLFADEAYNPGDKEIEGLMKSLITEPEIAIEAKFRGVTTIDNCLHIVMATNADWVIPATEDERRYFINEVNNDYVRGGIKGEQSFNYFNALFHEINNGGKEAVLYYLKRLKLGNWTPSVHSPNTSEMRKQVILSLPKQKYAIYSLLEEGLFPGVFEEGKYIITLSNLIKYLQDQDRTLQLSPKGFKQFLTSIGVHAIRRYNAPRSLVFPELGELRRHWGKHIVSGQTWSLEEKWTIQTMPDTGY